MTMSFRIPKPERTHVAALVTSTPELLSALNQALASSSPVLLHGDLADQLIQRLHDIPGADAKRIRSIVRTLTSMYVALRADRGMSASAAATEVVEAARQESVEIGTPPGGWDRLREAIELFFSDDKVLGLSAKAGMLASQNERHFHNLRVITDARPIFGDNAKDGPKAFSIVHQLQVFYCKDGEDREWFISLDSDDLESLQGAAERALAKERSLRTTLTKLNTPVLSWKVSDDVE